MWRQYRIESNKIQMFLKIFLLFVFTVALANGNVKDDLKEKVTEALNRGEKVKERVVNVVQEGAHSAADTMNENVETVKDKAADALKSAEKKLDEASKQTEKLKRQASETGEKVKAAAKDTKKKVEKQTEGLVGKLFHIFQDVKNSFFETLGFASKTAEKAKKKILETTEL